ncbi:DUF58 domain-containing protein [Lentzea sp. HUAS TT2]|uniref:DUF58 domain-containing protein n=1 Tax=Lentzea sp. HUAS TT2 TaxID=3447454 RepID=UPI003F6FFCAA
MAVAAVCLVAAGIWADYPELVTLGLAAAGALLVAVLWLLATPKLTVAREVQPRRVFEGEAAQAALTVRNVGRRRSPPLMVTDTVIGQRTSVPVPALAAGGECTVGYPLPVTQRGRYEIPPVRLGHSDPLRLMHRGRASSGTHVVHVLPRVHALTLVAAGGPQDAEGPTVSSAPLGGAAFHGLREYEPGDDWRRIHWGATARAGTLMARHVVVPDEPRQLVVLDTSAVPYSTPLMFEHAVRVAASFCVAAEQARLPFRFRTTSADERESGSSALEFLSTVARSSADRGLAGLSDHVRDVVSSTQGVVLTVITGRTDAAVAHLLTLAHPKFLSINLAQLVTSDPAALSRPRGVLAVSASNSEQFAINWNRLVQR